MHRDIHYNDPCAATNRLRAMADIRAWLGPKRMRAISDYVIANLNATPPINRETFRFMCGFAGIQGYPVEQWATSLGIPNDQTEQQTASSVQTTQSAQ